MLKNKLESQYVQWLYKTVDELLWRFVRLRDNICTNFVNKIFSKTPTIVCRERITSQKPVLWKQNYFVMWFLNEIYTGSSYDQFRRDHVTEDLPLFPYPATTNAGFQFPKFSHHKRLFSRTFSDFLCHFAKFRCKFKHMESVLHTIC